MELNNQEKSIIRDTAKSVLQATIYRSVWGMSPVKAAIVGALAFGLLMYFAKS